MKKLTAAASAALATILTVLTTSPAAAIIGGIPAQERDAPWHAIVTASGKLCGGAIITETEVLTAAHCVASAPINEIFVRTGAVDSQGLRSAQIFSANKATLHPNWKPGVRVFDIAIVEIAGKITETPNTHRVDLPAPTDTGRWPQAGQTASISGWGSTGPGSLSSRFLNVARISILPDGCQNYGIEFNPDYHICAGVPSGGIDSCQGDSGGGLVTSSAQAPNTLAGIVSFGRECGSATHPGVYTSVPPMMSWIQSSTSVTTLNPPTNLNVSRNRQGRIQASWRYTEPASSFKLVAWPSGRTCETQTTGCVIPGKGRVSTVMVTAVDGAGRKSAPLVVAL